MSLNTNDNTTSSSLYSKLRAIERACGSTANKNELADALIVGCLSDGLETAGQIITVITGFGFDLGREHIGARLTNGAGLTPEQALWRKTGQKTYALFDPDEPAPPPLQAAGIAVPTTNLGKPD